jgi:hypothetical protein
MTEGQKAEGHVGGKCPQRSRRALDVAGRNILRKSAGVVHYIFVILCVSHTELKKKRKQWPIVSPHPLLATSTLWKTTRSKC